MKKIIFLCLLTALSMHSFAQWTTSGNLIYNSNTGNVGIGISNPLGKLHILGNTQTTNFSTSALTIEQPYVDLGSSNLLAASTLYKTNNGSISWILGALAGTVGTQGNTNGYPGGLAFYTKAADGSNTSNPIERMRIDYNGNVGIGITNPAIHAGYNGITVNNATNGGYLEFMQAGNEKGTLYGDSNGLTMYAAPGSPVHIWANGVENMTILSNGNVGVGITAPVAKLHVNGNIVTGAGPANLDPAGSNGNISYIGSQSGLMLTGWNRSGGEGESDFIANRGNASLPGSGGFAFYDYSNAMPGVQTELMRVRSTGQVLIGVSNFATSPQYSSGVNMLAVAGGIETDAITVKTQGAPWPDYVFKPKYTLQPLSEVKAYIDQNHHLPEMPSEADVYKNGQKPGRDE